MNKENFCLVLESALLGFDGVSESELIEKYGLSPESARIGLKLYEYLKFKELKNR